MCKNNEKELREISPADFLDLVIAVIRHEDFKDFFKHASQLLKQVMLSSWTSFVKDTEEVLFLYSIDTQSNIDSLNLSMKYGASTTRKKSSTYGFIKLMTNHIRTSGTLSYPLNQSIKRRQPKLSRTVRTSLKDSLFRRNKHD